MHTLDVRPMPPAVRHETIFERLDALDTGETLRLVNDHDPAPLRYQQAMLWQLRRDPEGRRVAFHCGSIKASNACLVDFLDENLVAAVATNSWECCGWAKADALAAFFR